MYLVRGLSVFILIALGVFAIPSQNNNDLKKITGAACGPCTSMGQPQCGWAVTDTRCVRADTGGCTGDCSTSCGPGDKHKRCFGFIGSCTPGTVDCAAIRTLSCTAYVGGCDCSYSGYTGASCPKNNC